MYQLLLNCSLLTFLVKPLKRNGPDEIGGFLVSIFFLSRLFSFELLLVAVRN